MADGVSTEVVITRRAQNGWYTYTCDQLPGLFVASQDDRVAFEDLPRSISTLIQLDHGIECVVGHKVSYAEFLAQVHLAERAKSAVTTRTAELMSGSETIPFTVQPIRERSGAIG